MRILFMCLSMCGCLIRSYGMPALLSDAEIQQQYEIFSASTLVIEMPKLRFKSGENIDCSFYLRCKDPAKRYDGLEKLDVEPFSDVCGSLPYQNPSFFDNPPRDYIRVFFELYRIDGKESIAVPHKIGEKVPDKIACPKRNKNYDQTCDITKLFDIKPGKYKIRFIMQKVKQIDGFDFDVEPPPERDDNGNEIVKPEPSKEEKKELERRRAEALNKPRKIETIKASEWIEFEVVE